MKRLVFLEEYRNEVNQIIDQTLKTLSKHKKVFCSVHEKLNAQDSVVAAKTLDKSVSAVRQRIKRKDKPMPQGKVWKQEAKGCEIFINLKNYRKFM